MALIRDLEQLEPVTREKAKAAIRELHELGIKHFVNETLRTRLTQACYFLKGRVPLDVVNTFRENAKLYLLTEQENKEIATKTMQSKHLEGKALDIAPVRNGVIWWNADISEYMKIAVVMEKHGFEWGGRWKGFQDSPHYQLKA